MKEPSWPNTRAVFCNNVAEFPGQYAKIRRTVDEDQEPGYYMVTWDGKDALGYDAADGVYFYKLDVGELSHTKKMLLIK